MPTAQSRMLNPLPSRRAACACRPRRPMPLRWRRWSSGARCRAPPNEVLIEVKAAAVNPSDVKAATGLMPYAVFPRTPGRDYAGVVIDGPTGIDRARGVRLVRRSRHPARRHPCHASCRRGRCGGGEAEQHFLGGGRRHRRSLCHGDGRLSPRRNAETGRDRAGDGRQRQGRAGRGADRELARRARDRRGAQERAL